MGLRPFPIGKEIVRSSIDGRFPLARKLTTVTRMRPAILIFLLLLPFVGIGQKLAIGSHSDDDPRKIPRKELGDSTASVLIQGKLYDAIIVDGDTIAVIALPPAKATAKRVFKSRKAEKNYRRLVYHIKKVLPYAKLAGQRMKEVEAEVAGMSKKERKKRMKELEKEIKRDYEGDLMKLSFTQGRILIKLLDRETGNISYDIIKEFRGGFTAWFFQGIAKMFSYDLKSEYDAEGDDKLIEEIVQKIERGEL